MKSQKMRFISCRGRSSVQRSLVQSHELLQGTVQGNLTSAVTQPALKWTELGPTYKYWCSIPAMLSLESISVSLLNLTLVQWAAVTWLAVRWMAKITTTMEKQGGRRPRVRMALCEGTLSWWGTTQAHLLFGSHVWHWTGDHISRPGHMIPNNFELL